MRGFLRFPNRSQKEGDGEQYVDNGDPREDDEEHLGNAVEGVKSKIGDERGHPLTPR